HRVSYNAASLTTFGERTMTVAYIIHCEQDLPFVEKSLLRPLPSNGFDQWVASRHLDDYHEHDLVELMRASHVILAVVSRHCLTSAGAQMEMALALSIVTPLIVIQSEFLDKSDRRLPEGLWSAPVIDFVESSSGARRELGELLPPVDLNQPNVISRAQRIS